MKSRFILLNLVAIALVIIFIAGNVGISQIRKALIGEGAIQTLEKEEVANIQLLRNVKFSIYCSSLNELKKVKEDVITQIPEEMFEGIIIQPKASFIDSLMYDSKLNKYLSADKKSKKGRSLINKMSRYLPNELLINFKREESSFKQVKALEEYLLSLDYHYIEFYNIPSVKSEIKHFYFNKTMFSEIVNNASVITNKINFLKKQNREITIFLLIFNSLFTILGIFFIQFYDSWLAKRYLEEFNLLLKGRFNPKTYLKSIKKYKSIALYIVLTLSSAILVINILSLTSLFKLLDIYTLTYLILFSVGNITAFTIKKEIPEI